MKITLIELNLQCSMVTHQSALTFISDFFPLSEVATMRQTDGAAHKLKPRSFHKSAHCYKTKVWTDFRVRVRTDKIQLDSYIISL